MARRLTRGVPPPSRLEVLPVPAYPLRRQRDPPPPLFGGQGRGRHSACQALILEEAPAVPKGSPLLLAQKLPELGECAKDARSEKYYVCALNSSISGEEAGGESVSISAPSEVKAGGRRSSRA